MHYAKIHYAKLHNWNLVINFVVGMVRVLEVMKCKGHTRLIN